MPPPPEKSPADTLSAIVQATIVSVPRLSMAPPLTPDGGPPFRIDRPEIVTCANDAIWKMWNAAVPGAALRRTVNRFAPGPLIVTFLSINNSPLVRLIDVRPGAKLIVSPDVVVAIAARSVQFALGQLPPESAELFTVTLAASTTGARS